MPVIMNDQEFSDQRGDRNVQSVGPFRRFPVMVNGWTVPRLEAKYTQHGVTLVLDHRFALDVPPELAAEVVQFLADATAIAEGWSCHPTSVDWEPPKGYWDALGAPYRRLPWTRLTGIGESLEAGSWGPS